MPGHGIGTQRVAILESSVASSVVGHMDLGAIGKVRSKLMDDRWTEVLAEFNERGYWQVLEILRAENDNLPLSYEEGELVFGSRREVAQLDAGDYRACKGGQMLDESARGEIRQSWISVFGMFVMLKGFGQRISMVRGPIRKVLGILDRQVSGGETKEGPHRLSHRGSVGFLLVLPSCRADACQQVGVSYNKVASSTPQELMHEVIKSRTLFRTSSAQLQPR